MYLFVLLVIHCLVLPIVSSMLFGLTKKIKICIVLPWLQCFPTVQQLHIVKSSNKQRAAIRVIQYFCFCLTQSRSAAECMHQTTGLPALAGRQRGQGAGVRVLGSPMVTNIGHWSQQQSLSIGASGKSCSGPAHNTLFSAGNWQPLCMLLKFTTFSLIEQ